MKNCDTDGRYFYVLNEIVINALLHGWRIRKIQISSSVYLNLIHDDCGKIAIRISDHRSRSFRADLKRIFSIRVDRGAKVIPLLLKKLKAGKSYFCQKRLKKNKKRLTLN